MSKPRSDSLYARLTPEQRDELIGLLDSGKELVKAQALCKSWGVETALSSVSSFYSKYHFQWLLRSIFSWCDS